MNRRDQVLHAVAVKRHAPLAAIADTAMLPEGEVAEELAAAVATGRAVEAGGAYALTPLAAVALRARYSLHHASLRDDPAFADAYEGFERVNVQLKQIITDWQTVSVGGVAVANVHADPAHDAGVIDRLGALHERAEPVLAALARGMPRLRGHADKLLAALERAEDGDHDWVSDIRRDSYHTVWFELHEELLRAMGRERVE